MNSSSKYREVGEFAYLKSAWIASWIAATLIVTGCCSTRADLRVIRGQADPTEIRHPTDGAVVVVCPREAISLGWLTETAKSGILTDLGSVSLPEGVWETTAPTETRKFVLECTGECTRKDSVDVIVVTDGTKFTFSANRTTAGGATSWTTELRASFYSPGIMITSWRLNSPGTDGGWTVQKVDLDGTVSDRPLTSTFTSPWSRPIQLAGTYAMAPRDPDGDGLHPRRLPLFAEVETTLRCDQ